MSSMMHPAEARLLDELNTLEAAGNLRQLNTARSEGLYLVCNGRRYLNLSSNDYLGLEASPYAGICLTDYWDRHFGEKTRSPFPHSSPSSRLMTGNCPEYDVLESELAALYPEREALVLSCGYMVNSGLWPALTGAGDLILADRLAHASILAGLQQSSANFRRFRHNDVAHLEHLLQGAGDAREIWVVVESVYSMDGDRAPLREILELREKYSFRLCVDEAHAFGVFGPHGAGHCAELGLDGQVDLLVCTFGKALAGAGACVICSSLVKRYLINKMRPLIFSTALPPCTLQWDTMVVHEMRTESLKAEGYPGLDARRDHLRALVRELSSRTGLKIETQIVPLHAGSNEQALAMAESGREAGLWLTAIRHPTVPLGSARLRLSLRAGLTDEHMNSIVDLCNNFG